MSSSTKHKENSHRWIAEAFRFYAVLTDSEVGESGKEMGRV
jgi:hypothetical protein